MKYPHPNEQLAGCIWLPRILAKARLLQRNELPPEYAARFCHATGVDGQFLLHFNLSREQVLELAALPDAEVVARFQARFTPEQIATWNRQAVNFGRPGFPLAERLALGLSTVYKHLDPQKVTTIFEMLAADEQTA